MANLGALNTLLKLQRLLLPINAHNSFVSCHTYTSTLLLQNQIKRSKSPAACSTSTPLSTPKLSSVQHKYYLSTGNQCRNNTNNSAQSTQTATIDEFRAREEKREEEFEREHAAKEQQSKSNAEDEAKRAKVAEIRMKILDAAMLHVPALGWTRNAIAQGAEDVGLPTVVHGMFPEGGYALVSHFYGKCNDELIRKLQAETDNGKLETSDPVEFLTRAIRMRLEMVIPYKGQWPQALALIALPKNASTSLAQLLTLVDDICYYSGDRSVDFNWYTRRIGLATILKMTELYMLQDNSIGHANSWEFLKNRMDEAVQLQMMLSQTEGVTHSFQRSFNSAFVTARNILGLDYKRR